MISISQDTRKAFKSAGITLDMLGQPLKVGDRVLVKSYQSPAHDNISTIKRINKVNLVVDVEKYEFDYDAYHKWHDANPGKNWWREGKSFRVKEIIEMSRKPSDVILFNEQEKIADKAYSNLSAEYPEFYI